MSETKQLWSFTVFKKMTILREAEEIRICSAVWKFDVSESCIQDWKEKNDLFLQSSGQWRAFLMGKRKISSDRRKAFFIYKWDVALWLYSVLWNVLVDGIRNCERN